jgi:hypothetical protein
MNKPLFCNIKYLKAIKEHFINSEHNKSDLVNTILELGANQEVAKDITNTVYRNYKKIATNDIDRLIQDLQNTTKKGHIKKSYEKLNHLLLEGKYSNWIALIVI